MAWLARNADYLSPDAINAVLTKFKVIYQGDNINQKSMYVHCKHTSDAITTVMNLASLQAKANRDKESESRLAIYMSIIEPLIVNDATLRLANSVYLLNLLLELIKVPDGFKDGSIRITIESNQDSAM